MSPSRSGKSPPVVVLEVSGDVHYVAVDPLLADLMPSARA
jgi:hypothetical protein